MAHEIHIEDSLALNRTTAWHGIGNVITEDMDTIQALGHSGLDWKVEALQNMVKIGDQLVPTSSGKTIFRMPRAGVTYRDGTPERAIELGTVRSRWSPIQNEVMFDVAKEALGEGVKVESAGSLLKGKRVFLLLRGDSFKVGGVDEVHRYLLLTNAHDGYSAFQAIPTSIRVVCNNTLQMAIGKGETVAKSIIHCGNADARRKEMSEALALYRTTGSLFEDRAKLMARKSLRSEQLKEFWGKAWQMLHGDKELDETTEKAMGEDLLDWETRMEIERMTLVGSDVDLWLAANAITNHLQHREPHRETADWKESRLSESIAGQIAKKSRAVMDLALSLA